MPFGFNFSFKRAIGKTKTRSQMLLMKTDDGRLIHREVPVLSACAVDDEICAGYLLDGANQYQDEVTKQWFQPVDEKSTIPLGLLHPIEISNEKDASGETKMFKLLQGIFRHTWTIDIATLNIRASEERRNNMLYLALVIAVSIGAIAIAMGMF